jgi:hypothetical protein
MRKMLLLTCLMVTTALLYATEDTPTATPSSTPTFSVSSQYKRYSPLICTFAHRPPRMR